MTAEDDDILTAYPLSKTVEIDSIFDDEDDAQDEADRQLSLFGARRDYFSLKLKIQPLSLETQDVVNITDTRSTPRYGLGAGKNLLIVDFEEGMDTFEVQLGLWG